MAVKLINGVPLLVSGDVALSDDCCCTPSCIPDACIIPSTTNCNKCYDPDCDGGSCLEWQTIEVAIDGVGDVVTTPYWIPAGSCRDGFDCNCDVFNSTFIHAFSSGCSTLWTVREASPPFALFDTCGTPPTLACNNWRITRQVFIRVATTSQQIDYTTGVKTSLVFPNAFTLTSGYANDIYVCSNYSILPGHYVIIQLQMSGRVGGPFGTVYGNTKYFLYSFGNGVKVDPACADDQYYPGCGPYIGGEATLVASSRFTRSTIGGTPTYYADCNDIDELCQLSDATVSVEAPIVTDCPEEPPPPPPP
jgi:hypothetical protein